MYIQHDLFIISENKRLLRVLIKLFWLIFHCLVASHGIIMFCFKLLHAVCIARLSTCKFEIWINL